MCVGSLVKWWWNASLNSSILPTLIYGQEAGALQSSPWSSFATLSQLEFVPDLRPKLAPQAQMPIPLHFYFPLLCPSPGPWTRPISLESTVPADLWYDMDSIFLFYINVPPIFPKSIYTLHTWAIYHTPLPWWLCLPVSNNDKLSLVTSSSVDWCPFASLNAPKFSSSSSLLSDGSTFEFSCLNKKWKQ